MRSVAARSPLVRRRGLASPARCRGSVYLLVLGTAMLVTLLGLSALLLVRVERRMDTAAQDAVQARLFAQSAIELALQRMAADPMWRHRHANGAWTADATLGRGSISYRFTDPGDGDLDDDRTDPVLLTGRGRVGEAVRMCQVRLEVPGVENANLLINPGGEAGTTGWAAWGTGVEFSAVNWQRHSGAQSLRAEEGAPHWVVQNVTAQLQDGASYTLRAQVYLDDDPENVGMGLHVQSTGGGTQYFSIGGLSVGEDVWTPVEGTVTPTWTGTLTQAHFYVGVLSDQEFFVDDAVLTRRDSAPMVPLPTTWRQVVE